MEVFTHFVMISRQYAVFGVCHVLCIHRDLYLSLPVNLTQIYETAIYDAEYEHLPLLCTSQHPLRLLLSLFSATGAPDMASLRTEFRSIDSTRHGPYFRGYCGEHESEYQGTTQLAGTSFGKLVIPFICLILSYCSIHCHADWIRGSCASSGST
jgi:hypothetical protein